MGVNYNSSIVTSGLRNSTDLSNNKSFVSGLNITDTVAGGTGSASIPNSSVSWMNAGVREVTITLILTRLTANANYATNPFTKYNGTTDCSFSVYLFGNFAGAAPASDGVLALYSNCGGTWQSLGAQYAMALNQTVVATWQYNSTSGCQLWINGVKNGSRSGSGIFGTAANTTALVRFTPASSPVLNMNYTSIYDRELSDSEVIQNFNALRGRYNL